MSSEIDLDSLIRLPLTDPIPPSTLSTILSCPPFVSLPGTFNTRDLGNSLIRSQYIYRSGTLSSLTEQGKHELSHRLGVKKVFDIRSAVEFDANPAPEVEGVEVEPALVVRDPSLRGGREYEGLPDMYMDLLETHRAVWTGILSHVLQRPEDPFLIHCTGGKDRTGTIVALVYGLAGVGEKDIADEYALTRFGVEPVKDSILGKLVGGKRVDMNSKSFQAVSDMSPEVMLKFLQQLRAKYRGVEDYVREQLGFSEHDIAQIRRNLRR